jgi:hypothetical protein
LPTSCWLLRQTNMARDSMAVRLLVLNVSLWLAQHQADAAWPHHASSKQGCLQKASCARRAPARCITPRL